MRRASNPMRRSWLDEEGGWIPVRLSLMLSPAWQHRPKPVARLLERIQIEHLRHGGKENGRLCVSFDQLVDYGLSRRVVHEAIKAACDLGLLGLVQHDQIVGNIRPPNEYRLTYVPAREKRAPTDEWRYVSETQAATIAQSFTAATSTRKKPEPSALSDAPSVPFPAPVKGRSGSLSRAAPVPQRELSLISGGIDVSAAPAASEPPKASAPRRGQAGSLPFVSLRSASSDNDGEAVHVSDALLNSALFRKEALNG